MQNQIQQFETKGKALISKIMTDNVMCSIALTLLAMILLKSLALPNKDIVRAFVVLFIANILVLRFSHEYKLIAEGNRDIVDTVLQQPLKFQDKSQRFLINNLDINSNNYTTRKSIDQPTNIDNIQDFQENKTFVF